MKPRILRETLGISIRELAEALDYDKGGLSRLENGERAWTLRFYVEWRDYMELAVARARKGGLQIPDDAMPTMREAALAGPENVRTRRRRKKGGKGHARRKVSRRA